MGWKNARQRECTDYLSPRVLRDVGKEIEITYDANRTIKDTASKEDSTIEKEVKRGKICKEISRQDNMSC